MVDYKELILESLLKNGLIDEELYDKCSKPHIQDLPYDNRVTDEEKLDERKEAIEKRIKEEEEKIKDIQKENSEFEKEMYSLKEKIDDANELLDEYESDIDDGFTTNYEILDDKLDEIERSEGTSHDTYEVWGGYGYADEFEEFTLDMTRLRDDMDDLGVAISQSIKREETLNEWFDNITTLKKDTQDLLDYADNLFEDSDDIAPLLYGASATIRSVQDNIKQSEDALNDYIDEKRLVDSMTETYDGLERQVDENNLKIGGHMEIIEDYTDELKKI